MVEPVGLGMLGIGAYAGLKRVLGPTADVVASHLARFTDQRLSNVAKVLENAEAKSPEGGGGVVPPRVAMRLLEEGSYSDDEMVVDYLGGVLASSRTPAGRDDRGNTFTALVSRLSTYDLRTHYVWYSELRRLLLGRTDLSLTIESQRLGAKVLIPLDDFSIAMAFDEKVEDRGHILESSIHMLMREGLAKVMASGSQDFLSQSGFPADEEGIIYYGTVPGIALWLWGSGNGQRPVQDFLDPELPTPCLSEIALPTAARLISDA